MNALGALYSNKTDWSLSLCRLLEPEILADPYPYYQQLRAEDPVHWDPFLHAWVVTSYAESMAVLHRFSAQCAPTPEQFAAMGVPEMNPIAQIMMRQMLFMDPPAHTRLRALATQAFTPRRIETLCPHIQEIAEGLLDPVLPNGRMDVVADFAEPLSSIVAAELIGLPVSDHRQLKAWSAEFAEILGNFQYNRDHLHRMIRALSGMTDYFQNIVNDHRRHPQDRVIDALVSAEVEGKHLTDDAVIANAILVMVGAQETTPNLIANGLLSLLRNPDQLDDLRHDPSEAPTAVEELLRYESPSQHTTRVPFEDCELAGRRIQKRQAVIVVMGAANRDPAQFRDPDRLDLHRKNNKHLAFGGGSHFCFGAPLARIEGQIAFKTLLRRVRNVWLDSGAVSWRENAGLRGLISLPVNFS